MICVYAENPKQYDNLIHLVIIKLREIKQKLYILLLQQ